MKKLKMFSYVFFISLSLLTFTSVTKAEESATPWFINDTSFDGAEYTAPSESTSTWGTTYKEVASTLNNTATPAVANKVSGLRTLALFFNPFFIILIIATLMAFLKHKEIKNQKEEWKSKLEFEEKKFQWEKNKGAKNTVNKPYRAKRTNVPLNDDEVARSMMNAAMFSPKPAGDINNDGIFNEQDV